MEHNGWEFGNFVSKPSAYQNECKDDTWYGYRTGASEPASVSATFEESGIAKLTFGNCYDYNTVDVYFNNEKKSTASGNELTKKVTFDFVKGSKLRIESDRAIIKLNSLDISCSMGKD